MLTNKTLFRLAGSLHLPEDDQAYMEARALFSRTVGESTILSHFFILPLIRLINLTFF